MLDKSNFSIYMLHVTEIRIPFAGTRNRENLWYQKSSNWKRSIGGDIESWIFLPLSGNLAICHGISHVRGIGERRREGRILELRYTPCRRRSAGEIESRARLLATASRSFRVNPRPSHWIELNNKLLSPLWPSVRNSIISHPS